MAVCFEPKRAPSVEVFLALVRELRLNVADLAELPTAGEPISTRRARTEAEVTTTARSLPDAELQLYADFGKMLAGWKG